jgi:hypothetical protein
MGLAVLALSQNGLKRTFAFILPRLTIPFSICLNDAGFGFLISNFIPFCLAIFISFKYCVFEKPKSLYKSLSKIS